jgi:trk system potassium uptake protein TrkA
VRRYLIEVDDEVFFHKHIRGVMSELRKLDKPVKRVILAGGGNIGMRLADNESRYQVKIIERNEDRTACRPKLDKALCCWRCRRRKCC